LRLDFFDELKYQSSTILLSVGIKYSLHRLICDVNNYNWHSK